MPSKFQTISQSLTKAIRSGQLKKGDKVPSVRQLSQDYNCSKDTAQRALLELKYQNLIYAVPKSGYYVLEGQEQEKENLAISLEAYNRLAYDDFKTCRSETLVGRENYLFNYYQQQEGLAQLLDSLQSHLFDQNIYSKVENLVVTSGTQQALYILSQMAFPNGKSTILLEQPTYHRMNSLVSQQGLSYLTIERDFTGLDLDQLEELFKKQPIKFFYTIPRISNPLGLSYNSQEKQALVDLAQQYDVYIIEDDYMGDFASSDNLPLHYYDTQERVIYLKSFSTTLFPALRLGLSLLPQTLVSAFLTYKKMMDYDTSLIMQQALSLYLDNGMFKKNLTQLKHFFNQRQESAKELCYRLPKQLVYQSGPKQISIKLPSDLKLGLFKERGLTSLDPATRMDQKESAYLYLANDQTLAKTLKKVTKIAKDYK